MQQQKRSVTATKEKAILIECDPAAKELIMFHLESQQKANVILEDLDDRHMLIKPDDKVLNLIKKIMKDAADKHQEQEDKLD